MSKKNRARAAATVAGGALPTPTTFLVRWGTLLAGSVLVLAALAAYHNSFSGPFILDDALAITDNPTIRHLGSALSPSIEAPTHGRPILNLTFAINYALGGTNPWGYHAFNLLIHLLAGLTLFGLVRRTLLRPPLAGRFGTVALPLALAVAVIWLVHPLQTEAVTYISQRAESLMGLFYLLTLYCFVRSADETGERQQARGERAEKETRYPQVIRPLASSLWSLASVFSCPLGVMSKEIIVTAPVIVLLYDRTFVAGSFREAWRLRWRYYLGLAAMWVLLLADLRRGLHQQGVGFDQGVTWWSYALASCQSVLLYLKLAFWPHPLIFDYGFDVVRHAITILPYALVLVLLVAGTAIASWRWPVIGFAGAWFFVILSPTSSIVPVALQPMAEHRMYLSLAAVIGWAVLGLYMWMGRRSLVLFAIMAVGLGWLTVQRNKDYRSELSIWSDTSAKRPDNPRAHSNLGAVLERIPGRLPDAIAEYEAALRINPDAPEAHNNLGSALADIPGRLPEAISEYETALRIKPGYVEAHFNLGVALSKTPGCLPDAIAEYEAVLRIKPDFQAAHTNLGAILANIPGRLPEAISQFEVALQINPDAPGVRDNLKAARLMLEKSQGATQH